MRPRRSRSVPLTRSCGCQLFESPQAACAYSWISPPSRSRRTILADGAMAPDTPRPSGGACSKARCGRWPLYWHPDPGRETGTGRRVLLAHEQVAGLLGDPFCGWMRCHPKHVDLAAGHLQHEQHVQPLQEHGVHGEEVHRQHAVGLCPEELPPGQRRPLGHRFDAGPVKDGPDGAGCDPEAQAASQAAVGSLTPQHLAQQQIEQSEGHTPIIAARWPLRTGYADQPQPGQPRLRSPGRWRRAGRNPHLLHHALAAAIAANKEPASIIAAQLRHADGGALAQRVYIHQLPQTALRLAEVIEGIFGPAARETQAGPTVSAERRAEGTWRESPPLYALDALPGSGVS